MVPYDRPRGSVHDLAHLAELGDCRSRILCVSDRTLYLLHNFAAVDIAFFARFATELEEYGYRPLVREHVDYELFEEVVTSFRLEVLDMTCDIEAGLNAVAEAIAGQPSGGGGGCQSYGSPVLNCIVNLTNEEALGPPDSEPGSPGGDEPPEGFETWEEYFAYKCQAAAFIWDLERRHMVMLKNFEGLALVSSLVAPAAAGLLGILPAAMTPAGFAVFVASVVAIGVVAAASWFYMDEMIEHWDDNKDEIICALYSSGTSPAAISALSSALEDAIQAIITWGVLAPVAGAISGLLSTTFAQVAGNGIVEPLFKAVVAATEFEHDCSECSEGEADLYLTGLIAPFNRLLVGDDVTFIDEDVNDGYQDQNSNPTHMAVEFIAPVNIGDWKVSGECSAPDHEGETMHRVLHLERWTGSEWVGTERQYGPDEFDADEWAYWEYEIDDYPLTEGTKYRMRHGVQEFNWFGWWRRLKGTSL